MINRADDRLTTDYSVGATIGRPIVQHHKIMIRRGKSLILVVSNEEDDFSTSES